MCSRILIPDFLIQDFPALEVSFLVPLQMSYNLFTILIELNFLDFRFFPY